MDDYYDTHFQEELNEQGDIEPPWVLFPQYTKGTIGWRMGQGESALGYFWAYVHQLPTDLETRLAYLRRYPPAPYPWMSCVDGVLDPEGLLKAQDPKEEDEEDDEDIDNEYTFGDDYLSEAQEARLIEWRLVASDVAYSTWLTQQEKLTWPWDNDTSPQDAARWTERDFFFWARWVQDLKSKEQLVLPQVPWAWRAHRKILATGELPRLHWLRLQNGFKTLSLVLCAGDPPGPWTLNLNAADFPEAVYEDRLHYVEAFSHWASAVFEDAPHLSSYLQKNRVPESWAHWMSRRCFLTH